MRDRLPTSIRSNARAVRGAVLAAISLALAGCAVAPLIGGMASSAERTGSTTFEAEYSGLPGQTYAVVAWADRSTQSQYPALVPNLIQRVDLRLAEHANASGHVPGDEVTQYLANHPQWVAWPRSRLAEELDVDRIVLVEINEFRTNEHGNEYLWDGLGWATVSVIERGSSGSDAEAFRKEIRVRFPDARGYGPSEISRDGVASTLLKRIIDRAAWLFYTHDEPNAIK
ncbi:MAG: hypothetical protein ACF8LK_03635, partial [Phycisphaerales bacterium JB041]